MSEKIQSYTQFFEKLSGEERILCEVLRQIILEELPLCKEKMAYNVPFFYGHKRICLIWPAGIPRGGIKTGVLLGFCQGHRLKDVDHYLEHGTNKQVFYHIYHRAEEINEKAIRKLLKEAWELDRKSRSRKLG